MTILQLFSNLAEYHSLEYEFSEKLELLYSLDFEENGLVIRDILNKRYPDGITGLENVEVQGNTIMGIFLDQISPMVTKKFNFSINGDTGKVVFEQIDTGNLDYSEVSFAIKKSQTCKEGKSSACTREDGSIYCIPLGRKCSTGKKLNAEEMKAVKGITAKGTKKNNKRDQNKLQKKKKPKVTKPADVLKRVAIEVINKKDTKLKTDVSTKITKIEQEIAGFSDDIKRNPDLKNYWDNKAKQKQKQIQRIRDLENYDHSDHFVPKDYATFTASNSEKKAYIGRLELAPESSSITTSLSFAERAKANENFKYLDVAEIAALASYTRGMFNNANKYTRSNGDIDALHNYHKKDPFNEHPRDKDHLDEDTIADIRMVASALNKLPNFNGKVFRGTQVPEGMSDSDIINMYKPGSEITEKGFTSTAESLDASFSGNLRYEIQSKTGKSIKDFSAYTNEKEVLFRPDTRFKVTGFKKTIFGYKINMEEI